MKALTCFIFLIVSTFTAFAQKEDAILGKWISNKGSEKIEVYKKDNKYFGKLIWLKDSLDHEQKALKDVHNHHSDLKQRPLIGMDILNNLSYGRRNIWHGGSVYDFSSGRSYNCQVALKDSVTLNVRKYFGLAIMGRTETWKRISE